MIALAARSLDREVIPESAQEPWFDDFVVAPIGDMPSEVVAGAKVVLAIGFEPVTPRSTIWCSNQLSYASMICRKLVAESSKKGAENQ